MPMKAQPGSAAQNPPQFAKQPTLAFFSSSPGGSFHYEKWQVWRGIAEAAREAGFNLIYVAGERFLESPQAVLYQLIDEHNASGVIFWHSFVGPYNSRQDFHGFVKRYNPLPVVSIELDLEDCTSLVLDHDQGMRDALAHLVEKHGYRKIAFLYNPLNVTACQRQEAFERVMQDYGLYDPELVGSGSELDRRGLQPGVDYRAVVAQSDESAVHLIETLRHRRLNVPADVAVTGFNDGYTARGSLPPLTTLRVPFRRMGRQAVEILVQQISGHSNPTRVSIPLQLISRRSCGCLEPMAEQAAIGPHIASPDSLARGLQSKRQVILADMARGMGTSIENLALRWAEDILDIFLAELDVQAAEQTSGLPTSDFLLGLSELLQDAVAEDSNVSRWHEALSALRLHLVPFLEASQVPVADDLWHQARVMIGQTAVRAEIHRGWQASRRTETLREILSNLMISADERELLQILSQELPRLGVRGFFLVQYEAGFDPNGYSHLLLAYEEGKTVELPESERRFLTRRLLPDRWLPAAQPYSLVIEALHLRDEQIGYLVFWSDPPADAAECDIFRALRVQISSALKGVSLRQELHAALREAEDANALKSRFLSMVSHELRTPLNLIVGLSEMALRQRKSTQKAALEALRKYHEQIYISGQHLDRLIRDVLDLASSQVGQMRLIRNPLDLAPVLEEVAAMGSQLARQKNLGFRFEIPERLPPVYGDKTRLRQVLLNLLSNAVKFTARGEVCLRAEVVHLNGKGEIVISVQDTGLGIPRDEQDKIFDEFSQSSRTTVRGYGGIGLGLAISRLLVDLHGGKIWVRSNGAEGTGSTFSFSLPVMTSVPPAVQQPNSSRQGKVLILTRAPGEAQELSVFLKQRGFIIEEMSLAENADLLQDILASPPGAVVLDLAPAAEQGWEIMRELKHNHSTQDIPVLFFSLLVEQDAGGVVDMEYLVKPIGVEQLVEALKRHGLLDARQHATYTILIIDDEPGILDMHSRLVQTKLPACRVLTARDGKQGLELMREFLPDLVLLDLMMPVMDGFAVLKALQSEQMLRNIPVIVLSGQTLTEVELSRLNQGVAAVLGKGLFTRQEILERIEKTLSRSQRLGSEAQRLVHQAMAFIHANYQESIARHDIAAHLCINEQYLSRCFSREVGIGPMTYLSRYRIGQARQLLERSSLSITQVALEVGFSSQSYFSRLFQQEVGVTPSAYQRGERPPDG
jgi:signal transduction histidine kinase/DNA-binding LacI/PurR family transcriptional regulator/DNA-binding response OmpR family regulator